MSSVYRFALNLQHHPCRTWGAHVANPNQLLSSSVKQLRSKKCEEWTHLDKNHGWSVKARIYKICLAFRNTHPYWPCVFCCQAWRAQLAQVLNVPKHRWCACGVNAVCEGLKDVDGHLTLARSIMKILRGFFEGGLLCGRPWMKWRLLYWLIVCL